MAAYNKFFEFVGDMGKGYHSLASGDDVCEVYLASTAPSASGDSIKANLAELATGNGYTGGADVSNTYSLTASVATLTATDITWTATGGSFGAFRYVAMFNETSTNPVDPLIAWWDYGSNLTVNDGESFTVDFGASVFTLT